MASLDASEGVADLILLTQNNKRKKFS